MYSAWSWPAVYTSLTILILAVFGPWIGTVDGALFPVTTKVELLNIEAGPDGTTLFRMSFEKTRPCTLIGVTMTRNRVSIPASAVAGGAPPGTLATGPRLSQQWQVFGPPPLEDNFGIVWAHACPFAPWTTYTVAYP